MHRRIVGWAMVCLCAGQLGRAQEFKVWNRTVQVHGFASQGFVYTNDNNWLTMNTSQGSGAMTDMGLNMSTQLTDKFRVGAQVYDRNLGQLEQWHPSLDWALADYRFKPWFGIRGGKVKTTMGLYNDTQDVDSLHTFALLPQSVYSTDLRESTIAHEGGDLYGDVALKRRLGTLSYTAYAGQRRDSQYGGYPYLLQVHGIALTSYGGLQYGGDLRWATPLNGLLVGASRLNEEITGRGTLTMGGTTGPYEEHSNVDWMNEFYGEYRAGKLKVGCEWRRYWRDQAIANGLFRAQTDVRGAYVSASYRVAKRFQFGSYYSRYTINEPLITFPGVFPSHSHIYDTAITGRFDVNRYVNLKIEQHFMAGYGVPGQYPSGFYAAQNPAGLEPDTKALVLKTSFRF